MRRRLELSYDEQAGQWVLCDKRTRGSEPKRLRVADPLDASGALIAAAEQCLPVEQAAFLSGRGWMLRLPCAGCGGFCLDLGLRQRVDDRFDAERLASMYLGARSLNRCHGCIASEIRAGQAAGEEDIIWFDPWENDWQLWLPLEGSPGGISLPLEIGTFFCPAEQVVAAANRAAGELTS